MSVPAMIAHLVLERLSRREPLPRIPETDQIMDDLAQNAAFTAAGREDGALAFIYLYHAFQITAQIRPGERVLDMGCGPANQLVQIARLNPQAHFVGLDASAHMLDCARATIARCGVSNIELRQGDMTTLDGAADASFDGVISTISLHHLPDLAALDAAMRAARRVLKPGGGLCLVDFGRLKRPATQRFFAEDRHDDQPEAMTRDYFNSVRAAFSADELWRAAQVFGAGIERHATALAPFIVVIKNAARREIGEATRCIGSAMYAGMTAQQQR
ncbi:MAG: class I SAM-dependent methyltransferase, partial [Gallionellaceae bacterium]|nr:class I SAM-dependent methyltransferase [Gallionellaceae bacterium]